MKVAVCLKTIIFQVNIAASNEDVYDEAHLLG